MQESDPTGREVTFILATGSQTDICGTIVPPRRVLLDDDESVENSSSETHE